MDQDNVRDFFKRRGKPNQNENDNKPSAQSKNPWSMVLVQPTEYTENFFNQNEGNDNLGRGRGRGAGNSQAQSHPDFVPDPHNGAYPPQTKWTKEQIEIYNHIASNLTNGVEEDIIADLTDREGDEILIHLLYEKIQFRQGSNKKKRDVIKILRLHHRSMLLSAINEEHAYKEIVHILKIDTRKIGRETPPIQITELYSAEGKKALYAQGPKKKKAYIEHILDPYLTRSYLNTPKLASIIDDLYKLPENEIINIAKNRGAMMRYMYVEGGIQTQYAPISSPVNLHKDFKSPNDEETKNEFDNIPEGMFDDADDLEESAQVEDGKNDNENASEQKQAAQSNTKSDTPETPVKEATTADEIAAYKRGIEDPDIVMKIDHDRLQQMKESELTAYLTSAVSHYLRAHYGTNAPEMLEIVSKKNNLGILKLITTSGELYKLAKTHGFEPTMNIDETSPKKVVGAHPLKSNTVRRFRLQCTKLRMGGKRPSDITVQVLEELFSSVRGVLQHEICLIPQNSHSTYPKIWDMSMIESERVELMGNYIENWESQSWNDKNLWEFIVESTMDIHFVIQKSYSMDLLGNSKLQKHLKEMGVTLKVLDVDTTSKVPAAIISRSSRYDDINSCIKEIVERLSDHAKIDITTSQVDIEWRRVSLPSNEDVYAMMGVILVTPDLLETVAPKLIDLNRMKDPNTQFYTGRWTFYRGVENEEKPFQMKAGILGQKEYRKNVELVSVTGMAAFNFEETIPEFTSFENRNDSELTVMQLIKRGVATNDALGSPFETIFRKSKDEYIFEGTRQRHDRMMKYFDGGAFKMNMESWFKSKKCMERLNYIKITANKYSGSTVTRTSNTIEIGGNEHLLETNAHQGVGPSNAKDDREENEQIKLPPRPVGYGMGWIPPPTFPPPYYSQVGGLPTATLNAKSKSSTEEITVSTLSGTIGKTELMLLMNSIADQIKTVIETSFAVIQPQSRLVQCLDERDKRLKQELQSMLDNKVAEIVAVAKHTPKSTRIGEMKDDEDIPTDLKDIANATLNLMDDTQKALNFDKYMSQDQMNGNDENQLSPATAALKARMANTPLKQNWEEAAEKEEATSTAGETALAQSNENGQAEAAASTSENAIVPSNENEKNQAEETKLEDTKAAENSSSNEQENQTSTTNDENNQENPTSISNNNHYTFGFEGDESSTNSDREMGLDKESIKQGQKSAKRISKRLANLPPDNNENENDAT
eukprot:scaffold15122_cov41-Cyclotella_meneghiniana.AAC.3